MPASRRRAPHGEADRRAPLLHRVGEAGARLGRRAPRRKGARIALGISVAVLVLGFLVLTVVDQWGELRDEGVRFDLVWLLPGFAALVPFYVLNALGWDLLLRFLGFRLPAARAQVAWGQPLLVRYVPGSVLYVLARVLLSERAGVPRRICLASIVYEQALSAAAAMAIASYFLISHPDLEGEPWRWAVLAVVPLLVALLHPRIFGPLADRVLAAFGREGLPRTLPLRGVLAMLAYYAANWMVIGVGVFFVTRSVHPIGIEDLGTVASAQAIGTLAALASMVAPAGLGVRDAAFAWAVKVAVPSGSFAVGAVIALAVRAVLTVAELAYVGLVTAIARAQKPGTATVDLADGNPDAELPGGEPDRRDAEGAVAAQRGERQ